jgi:hypothetical protein
MRIIIMYYKLNYNNMYVVYIIYIIYYYGKILYYYVDVIVLLLHQHQHNSNYNYNICDIRSTSLSLRVLLIHVERISHITNVVIRIMRWRDGCLQRVVATLQPPWI